MWCRDEHGRAVIVLAEVCQLADGPAGCWVAIADDTELVGHGGDEDTADEDLRSQLNEQYEYRVLH